MGRVNKGDLAWAYTLQGGDGGLGKAPAKEALRRLSAHNIRHVRFALCPYYWGQLEDVFFTSNTKRHAYLNNLRELFEDANAQGIWLVPVLWWYVANFSWSAGNAHPQGNIAHDLKNRGFKRFEIFCQSVIPALQAFPNIAHWEIGNEYDLYERWAGMSRDDWRAWLPSNFYRHARGLIKSLDPHDRQVTTGNANYSVRSITDLEDAEAFGSKISLHYYRSASSASWTLKDFATAAESIRKPLYIGEIGLPFDSPRLYSTQEGFDNTVARLEELTRIQNHDAYWWQYRDGRDSHRLTNEWRLSETVSLAALSQIASFAEEEETRPPSSVPAAKSDAIDVSSVKADLEQVLSGLDLATNRIESILKSLL